MYNLDDSLYNQIEDYLKWYETQNEWPDRQNVPQRNTEWNIVSTGRVSPYERPVTNAHSKWNKNNVRNLNDVQVYVLESLYLQQYDMNVKGHVRSVATQLSLNDNEVRAWFSNRAQMDQYNQMAKNRIAKRMKNQRQSRINSLNNDCTCCQCLQQEMNASIQSDIYKSMTPTDTGIQLQYFNQNAGYVAILMQSNEANTMQNIKHDTALSEWSNINFNELKLLQHGLMPNQFDQLNAANILDGHEDFAELFV